jgi:hypothetical protein
LHTFWSREKEWFNLLADVLNTRELLYPGGFDAKYAATNIQTSAILDSILKIIILIASIY